MLNVRQLILASMVCASVLPAAAADQSNLLDPKDAFRLTVKGVEGRTAQVEFRIAPGYYLYRDRFQFETQGGRVISDAVLPHGKVKEDPFFGRTETYRDRVSIKVPLTEDDLQKRRIRFKIVSQGCADVGVCYIPQEEWVEVRLK